VSLIDVRNVAYAYRDGVEALRDVSVQVEKGERIAILGPNGAGKSTLFRLLNGLLLPSTGAVVIDGLPVERKNFYEIRARVGMVFQDSDDQLFNSTVRQEVAYGLTNRRLSETERDDAVEWALSVAGISGYGKRSPHNLSGGEKKRVALASVLAMKPDVLVLDEPTAALDPHGVTSIIRLLNEINQELGITLIFASHDADIIPLLADRVYVLNRGEVVLTGTTAEVLQQKDVVRSIGLRLPRVAHLAEILARDCGLEVDDLPLTIGQAREFFQDHWQRSETADASGAQLPSPTAGTSSPMA
jgi:cobalt/nickel transport system ATP-binding protein